ncbi:ribulokinase [Cyclobacterium marinum]|uniref:Ribulokinase n=1 Tax=Cyclobacterium marinum (strain ATCC 25205 / DSM 745 / LMG 13164 / NCIMB 1802) TaxID=880070 RepID=G0IYQ8_CYCMS|nr:ribulokinase [Cyclobacterium marinum]AEL27241.1 Carbohydrate kinase, FGGY [Cyclobacterium marinum DSM 745]
MDNYVLGVDYGTDSVRSILVNTRDGVTLASEVYNYPRWKEGKYCNPSKNQFRQHPLDHLEGLSHTVKAVMEKSGIPKAQVKGICVDTTGSSPLPVDRSGKALALSDKFSENPNAQMILWKDHTAIAEADEINHLARTWGGEDFTKYEGGIYSSEWFWAKILHIIREDKEVAEATYSWMEHCDYLTYTLVGGKNPVDFKRSRCAAGHKALWHESWGGLPEEAFLEKLDPSLKKLKSQLYQETYTSDQVAGGLAKEWATKLGLEEGTPVAVGTFDAHAGAIGGEVDEGTLVKVMGTSTCDIMVSPYEALEDKLVKGICGQVDGSVIPGKIGLEAGQSAFGDVLAWFVQLLLKPASTTIKNATMDGELKQETIDLLEKNLILTLSNEAEKIAPDETDVIALDWINGRRTPDANQNLKGAIQGLDMGSGAAHVFKALVDSICFGSKKIIERFRQEGVKIEQVVGLGGVAKKSSLVMQTLADVLNMPIKEAKSEQAPALGAAIYAATAAGIYPNVTEAIAAMGNGFDKVYYPNPEKVAIYQSKYEKYLALGEFIEKLS